MDLHDLLRDSRHENFVNPNNLFFCLLIAVIMFFSHSMFIKVTVGGLRNQELNGFFQIN